MNLLFICSRNQWRSPTAEKVFSRQPGLSVRSAGTSANARRTVREADLRWADLIIVMENKHRDRLKAKFGRTLSHRAIHVLHIPDEYRAMDPELVELLRASVEDLLARQQD